MKINQELKNQILDLVLEKSVNGKKSKFKRVKEKERELKNVKKGIKILPDTWEEFVKIFKIRSGEKYKQFVAYDYQCQLIDLCEKESTIIIIKSRQLGITQTIASYFLFKACHNPAYSAICFSRTQDDVSALSRRVRDMALQLEEYGVELLIDNVGLIKLKGLGEIYFKNSAKEGSRSYDSVSDFLFDEAAFVPTMEEIYSASSASSSMVSKSLKVIVSTPGSKLSWFYKQSNLNSQTPIDLMCKRVVDGELEPFYHYVDDSLCKCLIHWKAHPKYSQHPDYLEYRRQQDQTSIEVINREYNLTFEEIDEYGIFNPKLISEVACLKLEQWKRNDFFYLGVDTASVGDDYFLCNVFAWDGELFRQIELFRDRKKSNDYYLLKCGDLIKKYNPVCVSIESNSLGEGIYQELFKRFPHVDFNKFHTSANSKQAMIGSLQVWIESKKMLLINDEIIINEFVNFVRVGKQLMASTGHDDIVLSSAFALSGLIKDESINAPEMSVGKYSS